ncbi:MAG: carboxylesterase family protein [Cellvibrionaceae bacterium]
MKNYQQLLPQFTIFLIAALFLSCASIAAPLQDPIRTESGYVAGTAVDGVRIYRGIPYGTPPVGELRWKEPQPVAPWQGVRDATEFSPWAAQSYPTPAVFEVKTDSDMSEDSLYLNVLTPAENSEQKLPVMVWLHGGGLDILSGNMLRYNTPDLPATGAVVVTVNHRLGPFGYLAHPWLSEESPYNASGHYGNLDLMLALHWVQNNIAAFGGDPKRVTIFGQSGGGRKVNFLMTSPLLPEGYFHRAISMSSSIDSISKDEAEQRGLALTEELGVSSISELRATPWRDIVAAAEKVGWRGQMVVDGWALPQPITEIFAEGRQRDVPFMIGMVKTEDAGHFNVPVQLLPTIKPGNSPVYAYTFTAVPAGWKEQGVTGWHAIDMTYIFGDPKDSFENAKPEYVRAYPMRQGAQGADPGFTAADVRFGENFKKIWVQFAATGNPSVKGVVDWPPYTADREKYLELDQDLEIKTGYSKLRHGQ